MGCRRIAFAGLAWLLMAFIALASVAQEPTFRVRYRSADTVYLDAGRLAGLSVGDRLELVREGVVVATVEVVFVADRSASARPIDERDEILAGDLARPLGALRPPTEAPSVPPRQPPAADAAPRERASSPPPRRRTTRLSGVASLDLESYTDDDEDDDRGYDQTTARLSLRGRNLGGQPLHLRLRLRSRDIDRASALNAGFGTRDDQDRLYELSLRWAPDSDRFQLELGRLGAGPFAGIGYLDGVSGRVRVHPSWQVGAFYGQRPELADLGFTSAGSKYGIFSRWTPTDQAPWEVFIAGVREEDDTGLTRDVAILETRLGRAGGRWSLYQRAELDVGSSADRAADDQQLTQLALALTGRIGERSRFVLSYDRYDPVLLFEDRLNDPSQPFRDLLRQGLRASLWVGRQGGTEFSLSGGLREGEDDEDSTFSLGVGVRRSRAQGLTYSANLLAFSNPFTEGLLFTARTRYGFGAGHSVGLTAGATAYEPLAGDERVSGWLRFETWFELPASLFARGDLEVLAGDDAEGQRLRVGLGYRF